MRAITYETSAILKHAVFIDRDGVINRETGYVTREQQLQLLPGVGVAIRRLHEAGLRVVVVTNQSAVARGMLTEAKLGQIHDHLKAELGSSGAAVDGIYYCPHHPSEGASINYRKNCRCRKPAPGLLERAARELNISLSGSHMVGDRDIDIEAGKAAGCMTVLVAESRSDAVVHASRADYVCSSLGEAATWILKSYGIT